jgi:hypothetical protein
MISPCASRKGTLADMGAANVAIAKPQNLSKSVDYCSVQQKAF